MKAKKVLYSVFLFAVVYILSSCTSQYGFNIPGQKARILKNLSTEYYNVAEAYMGVKNYSKAAEYYKLAMMDKDIRTTSYYKLGRAYALAKDWENALPVYEDLLSRDKDNKDLQVSIAYIYAMKGDVDEALKRYDQLVLKNPSDQTLLENYIALLIDHGKGEIAEKQLAVLKQNFPDSTLISSYATKIAELVLNADPNMGKLEASDNNSATEKDGNKKNTADNPPDKK